MRKSLPSETIKRFVLDVDLSSNSRGPWSLSFSFCAVSCVVGAALPTLPLSCPVSCIVDRWLWC